MSRVHKPNKYMNTSKYEQSITNFKKVKRIHFDGEDYHKATSLTAWLFMKYDLSYKAYRRKSKEVRDSYRKEYIEDIKKQERDNE